MVLNNKEFIGLKIFTKSGQLLGRVVKFYISEKDQRVVSYDVCQHALKGVWHAPEHHIHGAQVIEITSEKMIVEDAVVTGFVQDKEAVRVVSKGAQEPSQS